MGRRLLLSAVIALSLCGPLVAASAVTEEKVRQWLAVWQKREGLEQWNVNLRVVRHAEIPDAFGDVNWWRTPGTAIIRVLCAEDMERIYGNTAAEARFYSEETVVHELMHIVPAALYDDGSGRGWALMARNPASASRSNAITDNLAMMLLRRRAPGGVPVARYIARQINSGPWKPARQTRERIMLQVVRAMNASNEDDVLMLARR